MAEESTCKEDRRKSQRIGTARGGAERRNQSHWTGITLESGVKVVRQRLHRRVGKRKKVLAGKKEAKVGEPSQGDEEFMDLHGGNIYQLPVALDFSVNVNPLGPPVEIQGDR